jgi:hypothetical protein
VPLLESRGSGSALSFGLNSKDRPDILIAKTDLQVYYDFFNSGYTTPTSTVGGNLNLVKDLTLNNRHTSAITANSAAITLNTSNGRPNILTGQNSTSTGMTIAGTGYQGGISNNFTYEFWALSTKTTTATSENTGGADGVAGKAYILAVDLRDDGTGTQSGAGVSFGTNAIGVFEHAPGYMPALAYHTGTFNGWTHIVVTYTNKQPRIYVNGSLVRTGLTSPKTTVFASNTLGEGPYGYHTGNIGHYAFYSRSISASEVLANYNATRSRYGL